MNVIFLQVVLLAGLLLALIESWWVVALVLLVLLARLGPIYGVLAVGFLVDGYFGAFATFPLYSLGAVVVVIVVEMLRDQLLTKAMV